MYSRDEVKAVTDKVLNMAKADAAEVDFTGGERSATRFANSNVTANMVQFEQTLTVTLYSGAKTASSTTREFDDDALKEMVEDAQKKLQTARDSQDVLPLVEGPQDYIPVDAALPSGVNFGPADRGRMVKQSLDICQKKGVVGSGYIPEDVSDHMQCEHEGAVRVLPVSGSELHPHVPDA